MAPTSGHWVEKRCVLDQDGPARAAFTLDQAERQADQLIHARRDGSEVRALEDQVEIMQLGRGHTKGDTVVWLPQERILFSGDLVEYGATPYTGDAYLTDWPHTLDAIADLEPLKLVPGRGASLMNPVQVKAGTAIRRYPAVKTDGPDDLVFQSVAKGAPMRDNNILVRHIKPTARALGIPWVNWQVLRRSFAMKLKKNGADVKDAQGQMRHSRASTTMDIYMQFVPESQKRVVDRLSSLSSRVQ